MLSIFIPAICTRVIPEAIIVNSIRVKIIEVVIIHDIEASIYVTIKYFLS